jgi:hypothetical protein
VAAIAEGLARRIIDAMVSAVAASLTNFIVVILSLGKEVR